MINDEVVARTAALFYQQSNICDFMITVEKKWILC